MNILIFVSSFLVLVIFESALVESTGSGDCDVIFPSLPITVTEGSSVTFTIENEVSDVKCCFVGDVDKFIIKKIPNSSPPFVINCNTGFIFRNEDEIEITPHHDNDCDDERYQIRLQCQGGKFQNCPPITISVIDDDVGACEDPHLRQKVRGIDEDGNTVIKNICYDLYGNAGDQFELISDNILKTSLVFELRDDYYIGKTFYQTNLGFFNVTTTTVKADRLMKKRSKNHYIVGDEFEYPFSSVEKYPKKTRIGYHESERSQTIKIVKVNQDYGKSYLNALVEESTSYDGVFDEHHGGIFGFIANQEYEFYDPVQDLDMTVVKINGRFVKAYLKNSLGQNENCYSMSLEDIVYPRTIQSFQKSL